MGYLSGIIIGFVYERGLAGTAFAVQPGEGAVGVPRIRKIDGGGSAQA
jgi:hypothetical protein